MDDFTSIFPEIKKTQKPQEINWNNCVVWKDEEYFYFIESKEIMYVSWSFGILSIIPSSNSFISDKLTAILVNSKYIFVGKNIKISN
ncbi:MAG: hypothetical protein N2446_00435 [Elusimicrobiales bacterium]|nr:hypothetical protein [Elusimicrobiales bacterium]